MRQVKENIAKFSVFFLSFFFQLLIDFYFIFLCKLRAIDVELHCNTVRRDYLILFCFKKTQKYTFNNQIYYVLGSTGGRVHSGGERV